MTVTIRNLLAGAAVAAMMPAAASAITISADSVFAGSFTASAGATGSVEFTADSDLRVVDIGVTYNGAADAADDFVFSIDDTPVSFDSTQTGATSFGSYVDRDGFVVNAGESFSFVANNDAGGTDVGYSYALATSSDLGNPDVIPLPATGFLLAGALGAAGFVARRKKA